MVARPCITRAASVRVLPCLPCRCLVLVWLAEACLALPSCAAQRELRSSVEQIAKFFLEFRVVSLWRARESALDLVTKDLAEEAGRVSAGGLAAENPFASAGLRASVA